MFTEKKRFFCFVFGATAHSGTGLPHSRGFYITHNDTPQSVGLLWTSDQLVAETSTCTTHNTHNRRTSMSPVGFEPTILAGERPQAYALDRATTGTGEKIKYLSKCYQLQRDVKTSVVEFSG